MVLPPPMTLTASPIVSVPSAWTLAFAEIVSLPLEPNSIVLPRAPHPSVTGVVADAELLTTAPSSSRMVALSPRLIACVLPTVSWAPGRSVTDWLAGLLAPWPPILPVDGLGALVSQTVVRPVVTQAAWASGPGKPPNKATPISTLRRRGAGTNDCFRTCMPASSPTMNRGGRRIGARSGLPGSGSTLPDSRELSAGQFRGGGNS